MPDRGGRAWKGEGVGQPGLAEHHSRVTQALGSSGYTNPALEGEVGVKPAPALSAPAAPVPGPGFPAALRRVRQRAAALPGAKLPAATAGVCGRSARAGLEALCGLLQVSISALLEPPSAAGSDVALLPPGMISKASAAPWLPTGGVSSSVQQQSLPVLAGGGSWSCWGRGAGTWHCGWCE